MESCLVNFLEGVSSAGRPPLNGLPSNIRQPGGPPGGHLLALCITREVTQPGIELLSSAPCQSVSIRSLRVFLPDVVIGLGGGVDGVDPGQGGLGLASRGDWRCRNLLTATAASAEGGGGRRRGSFFGEETTHGSAHRPYRLLGGGAASGSELRRENPVGLGVRFGAPHFSLLLPVCHL